jgi:hypothetical protein
MKYLLLLILPLLTSALVSGSNASANGPAGGRSYSSAVHGPEEEAAYRLDSILLRDDTLRGALLTAYVVAPRDTFPIQVGAFRSESNALRISTGMKNLSNIKVRIISEKGLYKVRITHIPEALKADPEENAIHRKAIIPALHAEPGKDTISGTISNTRADTSAHVAKQHSLLFIPDTSEVAVDTVYKDGEVSFLDGYSPWLKRVKYFGESFALVNALIITILFSIISMITLLVIILLNRRRMEAEEKIHQYLMEKYQSLIVDYLYGTATPEEFRKIASNNYSRQVLIDQMIDVSVNLKGEESKKLIGLYKFLGLDRDSLSRARDFRWHKKIKGFRELAFMNINAANDSIYKALNSKNEILRMEAQIALVRLSTNDHFDFLSHLERPFSLWEQITLHDLIIQHNIPVPSFKKWLTSSNDTVVLFALRMIREFRQVDAEEEIGAALLHKSPDVRALTVQVAGDLGLSSTLEIMKKMYKNQEYKICLEIVKSMGKMPDPSMLGFLKLVLDKEDDVQLQIEATKSIEHMGEEGVKALVKIMKSEYKNYNIIVRHVLDRRIN